MLTNNVKEYFGLAGRIIIQTKVVKSLPLDITKGTAWTKTYIHIYSEKTNTNTYTLIFMSCYIEIYVC